MSTNSFGSSVSLTLLMSRWIISNELLGIGIVLGPTKMGEGV
jgi:hypothetical protein